MPWIADLHIHSHYSRATSRDLNLVHLALWAQKKGIRVVGTGDIAHPGWLAELKEGLEPAEEGLFRLRPELEAAAAERVPPACRRPVRFLLAGEISTIYKKDGKVRKIHHLLCLPTFEAVERLQARLERIGNLRADGRPILGLDSRDLLEILLEVDERGVLIPAHIWTPWFALLGSKSGFDSVEACFEDLTPHIFALETGLSSDPPMNWRVSALDRYTLVSNSDAHSPPKLGREANLFETELAYDALFDALRTGDPERFRGTIEFFPEEGKYHYDGHRKCGVCWPPRTTLEHDGRCPVCGRPVTVGVMHRVEELADRPEGAVKPNAHPYHSLVPLPEVLGEMMGVGAGSKRVRREYERLLARLGPELSILLELPLEEIAAAAGPRLAEGIGRMRRGEVEVQPGFDGEYGRIRVFPEPSPAAPAQISFLSASPEEPPSTPTQIPLLPAEDAPPSPEPTVAPAPPPPPPEEDPLLADLNPEQREAVRTVDRPLLVVAGPGTGKTRTLTVRIAYLIRRCAVPPEEILAITFTNKAAGEMAERLEALLGPETARRVTVKTFHAFGAGLLRTYGERIGIRPDFVLATEEDRRRLLREAAPDRPARELDRLLERIGAAKANLRPPDDPDLAEGTDDPLPALYRAYQEVLRAHNALDYDDLVAEAVRLLESVPEVRAQVHARYRWISVDEYQDVNRAQYRLLRLLTEGGANLCAIGDPDQAIYGFRGADRRYFLAFSRDYPEARVVRLVRNYRSTAPLLEAALQVIGGAGETRRLVAALTEGVKVEIYTAPTDRAEAEYVVHQIERLVGGTSYFSIDSGRVEGVEVPTRSFGDVAVLYRLRTQVRPLLEAFDRSGIPYQTVGETPLQAHPDVRRLLAHLWLLEAPEARLPLVRLLEDLGLGPADRRRLLEALGDGPLPAALAAAAERASLPPSRRAGIHRLAWRLEQLAAHPRRDVAGLVARAVGFLLEEEGEDGSRERLERLVRRAEGVESLRAFLEGVALQSETDLYDPRADRVALMTLHAAKGLEFPVVFIVGCEDGLIPYRPEGGRVDLEEERRLFYVGMTRAKARLFLTHARRRHLFGRRRQLPPSPFLDDIAEALKELREARLRPKRRAEEKGEQLKLF